MGYESKLYVCKRVEHNGDAYNETLAAINMCKMGSEFYDLFKDDLNGDFFGMDADNIIMSDRYDEPLTYTTIDNVLNWCDGYMEHPEKYGDGIVPYWRIVVLWDMLASIVDNFTPIANDGREQLIVVHYGY